MKKNFWISSEANCKQADLINQELRNRNQCESVQENIYLRG
jgi:hypothetical protein